MVLPVLRRGHGPTANAADLPWPAFAAAAGGLGHVHVAPDNDGVGAIYGLSGDATTTGNRTRQTVNGGVLTSSLNEVALGGTLRF